MFSSLSHFDEGVFAVCNAVILIAGILLFAWWLSRRPPLPPEPKKPKYAERLQSQFKRSKSAKKQATPNTSPSDPSTVLPRAVGTRRKKGESRKPS
jgi:hypothetical protein